MSQSPDQTALSAGLTNLGRKYLRLGDARRASEYFEQALAIDRELADRPSEGIDLGDLGNAAVQLGDLPRALQYYEQALAIAREIGDRQDEGNRLGNLGNAYQQLGDARRAIGYLEQALAIRREIGDRRGEGNDLGNLGNACDDLGDQPRARRYYEQALAIRREIGDLDGVATDSYNLALLHARQGAVAQALPLAREAAEIWARAGHAEHRQRALQLVAQLSGEDTPTAFPDPAALLQQFADVIRAASAGAYGIPGARAALEEVFPDLAQAGWQIEQPIRRMWAGARDPAALTAGLDASDSAIISEILRRLQEE